MPTWRNWLGGNYITDEVFKKTEYYKKWNSILNNKDFVSYIEEKNFKIFFYPHQHTQKFLHLFKSKSENIKIINNSEKDIQDLLKESRILITDYSSVFMDFAYMNKPVLFYQFDYEEYRKNQLQEGYFNYKRDGFGPVCVEEINLYNEFKKTIEQGLDNEYKKRNNAFFELKDQNNCKRIYCVLKRGE